MDIFDKMKNGELIRLNDPEYPKVYETILRASKITAALNSSYHDCEKIRKIISELIKSDVGETRGHDTFLHRFWSTYKIRKNVFINHGCTFMDRGGINIEYNALIAPKMNFITENQ